MDLRDKLSFAAYIGAVEKPDWDAVNKMSAKELEEYAANTLSNLNEQEMRAMADEYTAHLVEKMTLTELEKTALERVLDLLREFLSKILGTEVKSISNDDIRQVARLGYAAMRSEVGGENRQDRGKKNKEAKTRGEANAPKIGENETSEELNNRDKELFPDEMSAYNIVGRISSYHNNCAVYTDERGNVVIILAATDDHTFVGFFREGGTSKWSSKMESSGNKRAFKELIAEASKHLPIGAELIERTSVSADGMRVLAQQLKHGYAPTGDTYTCAINAEDVNNILGEQHKGDGTFSSVYISKNELEDMRDRLEPYMKALGMTRSDITMDENGLLLVKLPVLRKTANETTESKTKNEKKEEINSSNLKWSSEFASNGEPFLVGEDGTIDLVDIPQEVFERMGISNIPFRLTPSMVAHVYERHKDELKLESMQDAVEAILHIMNNFDHVRQGNNGTYIFSIEKNRNKSARRAITIVLEYDKGKWLGIKTTGYDRISNLNELTTLWEKGENSSSSTGVATANVTSNQSSQGNQTDGIASNQNGVNSENKDSTHTPPIQTKRGKPKGFVKQKSSTPEEVFAREKSIGQNYTVLQNGYYGVIASSENLEQAARTWFGMADEARSKNLEKQASEYESYVNTLAERMGVEAPTRESLGISNPQAKAKIEDAGESRLSKKDNEGESYLRDIVEGEYSQENTAFNDNAEQFNTDITSGGVSQRASNIPTATQVVPVDPTKVKRDTQSTKNKIAKYRNGNFKVDTDNFNSAMRSIKDMLSLKYMGQSCYVTYNTPKGTMEFRLSNHNATGENFAKHSAASNVSVYVNMSEHSFSQSEIPYDEYRISIEDFSNHTDEFIASLADCVDKAIDTGVFNQPKFTIKVVENGKPLFSKVTPEMDAEYMDAVKRGDMQRAQRMVDEAARMAMPDTKVVDDPVTYDDAGDVIPLSERFNPEKEDIRFSIHNRFNSGYTEREDGTPISRNALDAEENGTYSRGAFRTNYKVSNVAFDAMRLLGLINDSEWHHTGKGFAQTDYFSWNDSQRVRNGNIDYSEDHFPEGSLARLYKENKKQIDLLSKSAKAAKWSDKKFEPIFDYNIFVQHSTVYLQILPEDKEAKEIEHKKISARTDLSSSDRRDLHRSVDYKYFNIGEARQEQYMQEHYEDFRDAYQEYLEETHKKNNDLETQLKENGNRETYLLQIMELLQIDKEEARRKVNFASTYRNNIRFSIIGENGAAALDKAEEVTYRMDNLAVAREMEKQLKPDWKAKADENARKIKMATGWERGAEGKWRYEIEDIKEFDRYGNLGEERRNKEYARYKELLNRWLDSYSDGAPLTEAEEKEYEILSEKYEEFSQRKNPNARTLGDYVDAPEIFKAYPELMDVRLVFMPLPYAVAQTGYDYDTELGAVRAIYLNTNKVRNTTPIQEINSILLHEIQHVIQDIEGFAKGGNSSNKDYNNLAGEVEPRNVQARMKMTPEQRRATLLAETEDVAREDQIFLLENSGLSAMGSRVDERMKEVEEFYKESPLQGDEKSVVDVYTGKANNIPLKIERGDVNVRVIMRQGREEKAGTKHSLYRHFNTGVGFITADDITLIPQILQNGARKNAGSKGFKYMLEVDGTRYTVYTESRKGSEEFCDFYSNRNKKRKGDNVSLSNTQLSARAHSDTTNSTDKGTNNSDTSNTLFSKPNANQRIFISNAEQASENGGVLFSIVTDPKLLEQLESGKKIKVYRTMVLDESSESFAGPMSSKGLSSKGKGKATTKLVKLNQWEEAEEHPEVAVYDDKLGYSHVTIIDDAGGRTTVAYNPYIHTSLLMLNDQFSKAWRRPNMVVVECEVPVSELTSGYIANGAKDSVGETEWTKGVVARTYPKGMERKVILTRYAKPIRIVPLEEYAQSVKDELAKRGVLENGVPFNVITPAQRDALAEVGVPIVAPESGSKGQNAIPHYEAWKNDVQTRLSIAEKVVENVIVDTNETTLPTTAKEAIAVVEAMQKPFINKDQNKEIKVSNSAIKHTAIQDHEHQRVDVRCLGVVDKIIENAVKIGNLEPNDNEKATTNQIEVYYCPVNIDGTQYSVRMVVKQYKTRGSILEDFRMYDMAAKREKPDVSTRDSQNNSYISPLASDSAYKVKELIHNSQEEDKKLLGIEGQSMFSIANNEQTAAMNAKQAMSSTPMVEIESELRFSISKNNRQTIRGWMDKRSDLTDDEKASVVDYISNIEAEGVNKATLQLALGKWFATGMVRLPEDYDKVVQAVRVAEKKKANVLQYRSPMEVIETLGDIEVKEKPINPDEVSTLHIAKRFNNGLAIYDVDDSQESRENMRRIINTHFGKESSPWCLLQGDGEGNLTEYSKDYWYHHYNAYPKQVAFMNGKLVAFSANSYEYRVWWDRQDHQHDDIPVIGKIKGDKLGRSGTIEYSPESGKQKGKATNLHKGDRQNGLYQEWHDNGQLHLESNYKNGMREGLYREWYDNGQLAIEEHFRNGRTQGDEKIWYYDGQLKRERNSNYYRSWHENGQIAEEYTFIAGKYEGVRREWYENGKPRKESTYKNGNLHGISREWDSDGRLRRESSYKEGILDGFDRGWDFKGRPEFDISYKDGKRDGLCREWHNNGKLATEATYKDDKLNGLYREWYENGTLEQEATYKNGKLEGLYRSFSSRGVMWRTDYYSNGDRIPMPADVDVNAPVERTMLSKVEETNIEELNAQFNEQLQQQIDGTLPSNHTYELGRPSAILRSAGIPDLPIEMMASRLEDKSMQENHPFELSEVKDLVSAIHHPLAVFRSATHIGSNVILTHLRHNNQNYVAAIQTNRRQGRIFVNSVRSLHYKNSLGIVNWINEGLADYIKPTFMEDWFDPMKRELLSKPQSNSADVRKQLSSAANVIENFENPKLSEEKSATLLSKRSEMEYARIRSEIGLAAEQYERRMDMARVQEIESWQDSMRSLVELQRAVEAETGEKLPDAMNAYLFGKSLTSVSKAEMDAYSKDYFNPIIVAMKELMDRGINYDTITDYLIAKHGIERNIYMARKQAEREYPDDLLLQIARQAALVRSRDFAGLTNCI